MKRPASRRDRQLLFLSALLWGAGVGAFTYFQPLYIAHLGATPEQIGAVLGLSGLLVTFLYIPIGLWADRRGRKPVMIAGWSLATASTFAIALAPDWRWLIPGMTAYMLSIFAMPAYRGYVAAGNNDRDLSRTFAILASGVPIGAILSPAAGGWIAEEYGLRAVYLAAGIIFSLSTAALLPLSHQPVVDKHENARPGRLLSDRGFMWQVGFGLLLFFALELGHVLMPKFLEDVRGLTVIQIGWLGTLGSLGVAVLGLLLGLMPSDRRGSLLLSQLAALAALIIWIGSPGLVLIGLAFFLHGGNFRVRPIVHGRVGQSLGAETMSFGFGLYETAMRMGLALAPAVAGVLYARDPYWPLYGSLLSLCLTLVLTMSLPGRMKRAPSLLLPLSPQTLSMADGGDPITSEPRDS